MIKVLIIFTLIVTVMMIFTSKGGGKGRLCGDGAQSGGDGIHSATDAKTYSQEHSRSIQDDIKKVVGKNI